MKQSLQRIARVTVFVASLCLTTVAGAANSLSWNTNQNIASADIDAVPLIRFLEGLAQLTGWQVYVESNATHTVSAKFTALPGGEALRMLLGNLSFALVPAGPNTRARLYVFHSSARNATQLIRPNGLPGAERPTSNPIPDELIVTLKPGTRISDIACLRDAKVLNKLGKLDVYRLKFADEDAARQARTCLADNPDVEVDFNFVAERPDEIHALDGDFAADLDLKLKEAGSDCTPVIALVDTGFGSLGPDLDKFFKPALSVAGQSCPDKTLTHGSAMAGTILRSLQTMSDGRATSAMILPVDVYGCNPSTTTFDVAYGIYAGVNAGANIVNLSLGSGGDSTMLHRLIKSASDQGVVFFAAAGNEPVTTPFYPAAYPEVLAVTAGDRNGQLAPYANRGEFVDIIAPGTSVIPYQGQSFVVNGTSTAAAYASGLAASLSDQSQECPQKVVPGIRAKLGVQVPKTP